MELTKLRRINNTGTLDKKDAENLPGYAGGLTTSATDLSYGLMDWMNQLQSYNNNLGKVNVNANSLSSNDVAGRYNSTIVPEGTNVLPNGLRLSTTTKGNFEKTSSDNSAAGINPWFALGSWLGGGVLEGLDRVYNQYSPELLLTDAGTSQANAGGISYNILNQVSKDSVMNTYDKQWLTDWLTNPTRALTGILGRGKAEEQAQLTQTRSINIANMQTGNALTESMRLNYNKEHGDSSQQYLHRAKDGKLPKFNEGKKGVDTSILPSVGNYEFAGSKPVYTPFGATYGNIANAKLDTGEVVYKEDPRGNITYASEVDPNKTQTGTDKNYGLLAANDGVFTNQKDNGIPISAADAAKIGDFNLAKYLLNMHLSNLGKTNVDGFYAKHGKLPKYAEGAWANNIISGIGMLNGLGLSINTLFNKPHKPNTYVDNPYEFDALNTLAGLRVNPYPIIQEMRNAESRTNRAIDRSGGLSVAQRNLGRLSALYGTLSNIANTLAGIQSQNNQYKANYAQAALNAGHNTRIAKMNANQWDLDYFSKAHAARLGGIQTGLQNALAQAQNWYKNDFKRRQFNDTMALYRQEQLNTAAANEAMRLYNQQLLDIQKLQYMSDDWLLQEAARRGLKISRA